MRSDWMNYGVCVCECVCNDQWLWFRASVKYAGVLYTGHYYIWKFCSIVRFSVSSKLPLACLCLSHIKLLVCSSLFQYIVWNFRKNQDKRISIFSISHLAHYIYYTYSVCVFVWKNFFHLHFFYDECVCQGNNHLEAIAFMVLSFL